MSQQPSKRMKRSSEAPSSLLDKSSPTEPMMAQCLPSEQNRETIGSKGVIKRAEFIRILTRALYSLGYDRSGALLEEESGISLHSTVVSLFMHQVLDGRWDESIATLHTIGLGDASIVKSASFLILEQKFLELVKMDHLMDALATLRNDIVPLYFNMSRVHALAASIISPSQHTSNDAAVSKSRSDLLRKLQKLLPASVLIPERRLESLVEQALDVQREACVFHNSFDIELSLYSDHRCGKNQLPCQTLEVLQGHRDEVWFVEFSHNGKFLASSSRDQSAIIWEVKTGNVICIKHTLNGHKKPVLSVSWSPEDDQLLTCGLEEAVRRWDVGSGQCLFIYEKSGIGVVSCGWFPDGKRVFTGMTDKSICLWDFNGGELESWKGQRTLKISDMAITSDGKRIISICRDSTILLLDREAIFERLIEEEDAVTSFALSKDNKFLLVNLINQEIHLWKIDGDPKVVSKYIGHRRSRFVIRSCFGGLGQKFIASGSEDSKVYIWRKGTGELLVELAGHSGSVNSVSWNPANPHMLASASDDRTVRIWGLDHLPMNGAVPVANGC